MRTVWISLAVLTVIIVWMFLVAQVYADCTEICQELGDGSLWCKVVCDGPPLYQGSIDDYIDRFVRGPRTWTGIRQRLGDGSYFQKWQRH